MRTKTESLSDRLDSIAHQLIESESELATLQVENEQLRKLLNHEIGVNDRVRADERKRVAGEIADWLAYEGMDHLGGEVRAQFGVTK